MKFTVLRLMCIALGVVGVVSLAAESPTATPAAVAAKVPARPFTGIDYSGVYDCKGQDSHEGPYDGKVTLSLVRDQSDGPHGAYRFTLEVPGYGAYPGFAAARGNTMGVYFANTDPAPKDYGTGVATFSKDKAGRWTFRKFYYEPDFKGGNFGTEVCVRQSGVR